MTVDIDKRIYEGAQKVDQLTTEYLREITSLSKIFITLSIAFLGLTMNYTYLHLPKIAGYEWIICSWLILVCSSIFGFLEIFFFSRRFKKEAEYIDSCLLVDVVARCDKDKLNDFIDISQKTKRQYGRHYIYCISLVSSQALFLFLAFFLFGMFLWNNFHSYQ